MEKLLSWKPWQIFLLVILGFSMSFINIKDDIMTTIIIKIIGLAIYNLYILTIGHFMQDYLPKRVRLNHVFFQINAFIWFATTSVVMILSEGNSASFSGATAIPFFYVSFAALHFILFPAKTLKSVELKKEAEFGDYIGDFFLIMFLPIGIWILQPRINRIIEEIELTE
jgi:hypothetical protein